MCDVTKQAPILPPVFDDIVRRKGLLSLSVVNPLTPKSDQYINSPYNFNTLSSRQVMRKLSSRGYYFDIRTNSQD